MRMSSLAVAAIALSIGNCATAVIVDPSNSNGWAFYTTDNTGALNSGSGTFGFVNGPATPPAGVGSFNMQTPSGGGDQSVQARLLGWEGTPLSALTSLGYSTYASAWNGPLVGPGGQLPYLTLYIDTNGDTAYDDRIFFEPEYSNGLYGNSDPNPQAATGLNMWQSWDVLNGMVYNQNGPSGPGADAVPFSVYLTANPTAKIVESAPGIGGIRLATGFASDTDDFNTNIDSFTISTSTSSATYDFEPAAVPEASSVLFASLVASVALGKFGISKWRHARN